MFIVTFADVTMVTASAFCCVALTPATNAVSSSLALCAILPLTGLPQGTLVFISNRALAELAEEAFIASELEQDKQAD